MGINKAHTNQPTGNSMFYTLHIEAFRDSIKTDPVFQVTTPEIKGATNAQNVACHLSAALSVAGLKTIIIRRDRKQRGKWLSA